MAVGRNTAISGATHPEVEGFVYRRNRHAFPVWEIMGFSYSKLSLSGPNPGFVHAAIYTHGVNSSAA